MKLAQRSVVQNGYDFDAFWKLFVLYWVIVCMCWLWLSDCVTVYQNLKFLLNEKETQLEKKGKKFI